jgi:predicted nucleic acid-binding protein
MSSLQPFRAVIDASVGITLFLKEPLSAKTHSLFALLTRKPRAIFYVPDLFYIECTNIILKYVRRGTISATDATAYITALEKLALVPTSTQILISDALSLATTRNLSAYDACYVALSTVVNAPLLTGDERMVKACTPFGDDVHSLTTFAIPPFPSSE